MYLHTRISALLGRYAPKDSPFYKNCQPILDEYQKQVFNGFIADEFLPYIEGILESLKDAYVRDYFGTITQIVTAEIFSDFLEMAEYFLTQGDQYKHPAAFLIGGVLEEHLRKLAIKYGIPVMRDATHYRNAEDLNMELRKSGVYTESERKTITSWLGLRNDADHAHWSSYSLEKVEVMLKDVRRIINQYPA
jgi:hypothetical protein